MSKLVFPGAGAPYRGFIGEVRGWLQRIGSYHDKSPASATALRAQLQVLVNKLGGSLNANNAVLAVRNYLGAAYTPARTAVFKAQPGSTPDQVWLGSTELPLISGTKVTGPAVTGTYVNGYTFTIVNGAITAIVAS